MQILRVQLANIKSYEDQTIEFAPGTNSICGENGAGKSTILEAIGWALFDSLPYAQRYFVRDGASAGTVVVTFGANDGRTYQAVRRAGTSPHWYIFDQELNVRVAEGASDVKEWVRRQIGTEDSALPKVLFENAIGVPQGSLCAPFLQSPEKRKDTFDPILRVHEYAEAHDKLRETRSYINDRIHEQQTLVERLGVEAGRIPELEEQVRQIEARMGEAEASLRTLKSDLERQRARVAELEGEARRVQDLRNAVELLRAALSGDLQAEKQARLRVEQAWQAQEIVERALHGHQLYLAAERELGEVGPKYEQYIHLRGRLGIEERTLEHARKRLSETRSGLEEAERAEAELAELEARAAEARKLDREAHALEAKIQELQRRQAEARRLDQELRASTEELGRTRAEVERIEGLREQSGRVTVLRESLEELTRGLATAESARQRLESLRRGQSDTRRQLADVAAALGELERRTRIRPEEERLAGELERLRAEKERTQEEGTQIKEKLAAARARKESRAIACPLDRSDCLEIQRRSSSEEAIQNEIARLSEELERARERYQRCAHEVRRAEEASRKLQAVQGARGEMLAREQQRDQLSARVEQLAKDIAEQEGAAARLPSLRERGRELRAELGAAERASAEVGRLPDLARQVRQLERHIGELAAKQADLAREARALEDAESSLAALRARSDELRGATEAHERAKLLVQRLPELRRAHDEQAAQVEAIVERIGQLEHEIEGYGDVEERKRRLERQTAERRADHEAYVKHQALAEDLAARQLELKRVEAEIARKREDLDRQEGVLDAALRDWNEQDLADARDAEHRIREGIGGLTASIRADREQVAERRRELERRRKSAREQQRAVEEQERLEGLQELLAFARETIKNAQKPVTEALLYSVSQEARALFSEILDDHSARLEWTPDYEVQLERGSERLTFGQLSGGEQMSAALAVRLALLKKLSDVDIAFLDEPTQNMDEARRTNLAAQVGSLRGFGQLFVISHDDTFERQVSHAVVVYRQNGSSVVRCGHQE